MYVVRRTFRNYNKMITPGSIVEPGDIKWFKTRLRDRDIVEVTEQNLETYEKYFVGKFGVSIKEALAEKSKAEEKQNVEEKKVVVVAVNK